MKYLRKFLQLICFLAVMSWMAVAATFFGLIAIGSYYGLPGLLIYFAPFIPYIVFQKQIDNFCFGWMTENV